MPLKMNDLRSIFDLNSNNVWIISESEIAQLWHRFMSDADFQPNVPKWKNILRLAFDLETIPSKDEREKNRYSGMGYVVFNEGGKNSNLIALRKKKINRITDLSYENVKHISAETLMGLLANNFGGGWDSIALSIRDIIESAFDVSTTMLPTDRLHLAGGTRDRKVADGYEVLEIPKGSWTEAIFAKKKDPVEKLRFVPETSAEEDLDGEDDDENDSEDEGGTMGASGKKHKRIMDEDNEDEDPDAEANDDTFYNSYIPEADLKDDPEEIGDE